MIDVPFPTNCKSRNLTYLSAFHKILNCFAHRAVTDVLTMFEVVKQYDWEEVIANANSPVVRARAITAAPNWNNKESMEVFNAQKDLIKKAGFRWDGEAKTWERETKQVFIEKESPEWEFQWKLIEGERNEAQTSTY